jgi:hypothetical protein
MTHRETQPSGHLVLKAMQGPINITGDANLREYTYGAFVSILTELMVKLLNDYDKPDAEVIAVATMQKFPPGVSHRVSPLITKVAHKFVYSA